MANISLRDLAVNDSEYGLDLWEEPLFKLSLLVSFVNGVLGVAGLFFNASVILILSTLIDKSFTPTALRFLAIFDSANCLTFGVRAGLLRDLGK